MKLYKMTEAFNQLSDSDLGAEYIKDTIESLEYDFQEKGVNIIKLTSGWESDVEAIDSEIKRLQARKKAIQNKSDSLREYLRQNMQAAGISKIECPLFNISLSKPTKVAVIDNDELIPDEYVTVKTVVSPDKRKILSALKDGVDIPGARLEDGNGRLTVR